MRYDPILCMNVSDSMKAKDARTVDASFNVVYKSDSGTMQALVMAANEKEAEQKVRSREGNKFVSLIGVKKMSDNKSLDKAIRNCDALSDLRGAISVGNGYVKDTGSEFIVYDSYGNVKGRYATFDEAANHARNL